jgi:hypothetical protein
LASAESAEKQNAALTHRKASAVTAEKRVEILTLALSLALDDVGHKGSGPRDEDHFYCEYCKADHPDYTLIPHHAGCKVTILRRVLAGGEF